ncbi:hypothetical protein F5Y17DRAFT_445915 [Xylariaceae sp. FL0594]|nr:hypothetical protein F5Y17DRAFT_445915 [Xylariaceae sp. FL0594]
MRVEIYVFLLPVYIAAYELVQGHQLLLCTWTPSRNFLAPIPDPSSALALSCFRLQPNPCISSSGIRGSHTYSGVVW